MTSTAIPFATSTEEQLTPRNLLAGMTAVSITVPGIPSTDERLIRLCLEFTDNEADYRDVVAAGRHLVGTEHVPCGTRLAVLDARNDDLLDAIATLPATTMAGLQAKAQAALARMTLLADGTPMDSNELIAWSLLQDILNGTMRAE